MDNLSRLASKPGVQSTLILSKHDGSIIRSTGLLALSSPSVFQDSAADGTTSTDGSQTQAEASVQVENEFPGKPDTEVEGKSAQDVARLVFAFVSGAKAFTEGLETSDEVKLLRLRTRKSEIVIVPDTKFLLVVIHDTAPA